MDLIKTRGDHLWGGQQDASQPGQKRVAARTLGPDPGQRADLY